MEWTELEWKALWVCMRWLEYWCQQNNSSILKCVYWVYVVTPNESTRLLIRSFILDIYSRSVSFCFIERKKETLIANISVDIKIVSSTDKLLCIPFCWSSWLHSFFFLCVVVVAPCLFKCTCTVLLSIWAALLTPTFICRRTSHLISFIRAVH